MTSQIICGLAAVVIVALLLMGMKLHRKRKTSDINIPAPDNPRRDVFFGYFQPGVSTPIDEVRDHVNLLWTSIKLPGGFTKTSDSITKDNLAPWADLILKWRGAVMLDVEELIFGFTKTPPEVKSRDYVIYTDADVRLRRAFTILNEAGALEYIKAITPMDEPNIEQNNACQLMRQAVEILRSTMIEFTQLTNTKLAINYSRNGKMFDCGLELFDIVGFDDYPARSSIFRKGGPYQELKKRLKPGQMTMIFPGGYSDYRQDPTPFVNYALANSEVWGVICFLWLAPEWEPFTGIRGSELEQAYREAGLRVIANYKGLKAKT